MEKIVYEDTTININEWLESIRLREIEENKNFIIDINNKYIEGEIIFNGFSKLLCCNNLLTKITCPNVVILECSNNNLVELYCENVVILDCANNKLTELILDNVIVLNCHDNKLSRIECQKVNKIWCDNNELVEFINYNIKEIYCNNNKLTTLYCPNASKLHCFNNQLTELVCLHATEIICDNECNVLILEKELKQLNLPKVIQDNYECDICGENRTSKIVCKECSNFHCVDCYISIFKVNIGLVKCPSCRFEINFDINIEDIDDYIDHLYSILT